MRRFFIRLILLSLSLAISAPSYGQSIPVPRLKGASAKLEKQLDPEIKPDAKRLERLTIEKNKAEARKIKLEAERKATSTEIEGLRKGLIIAAAQAQTYEKAVRSASEKMSKLNLEKNELIKTLEQDRAATAQLLAVLQRLERNPPPAIAVQPQDAAKAAQAAKLMASITLSLGKKASIIKASLADLDNVETRISQQRATLKANERDLAKKRKTISGRVKEKTKLEASIREQTVAQDKIIQRLVSEADDLKALIASFKARAAAKAKAREKARQEALAKSGTDTNAPLRSQGGSVPYPRKKPQASKSAEPFVLPPDTKRFADARGALPAPVQGKIKTGYRKRLKDGSRTQGITVGTSGSAQVIAPYTGRIAFVGPFKDYENVFMLDVGHNYFVVMTGLSRTYGHEGDVVKIGEPVGVMPSGSNSALYIEIWKNNAPVDPTPWLGKAFAKAR